MSLPSVIEWKALSKSRVIGVNWQELLTGIAYLESIKNVYAEERKAVLRFLVRKNIGSVGW